MVGKIGTKQGKEIRQGKRRGGPVPPREGKKEIATPPGEIQMA